MHQVDLMLSKTVFAIYFGEHLLEFGNVASLHFFDSKIVDDPGAAALAQPASLN